MKFESDIELIRDDQTVDAKSILHMLTLGCRTGN